MPEYLAPGLYVEEIDSGSKPIEGVGVNTAAFIGFAKSGEFNRAVFVSSWSEFERLYGEDDNKIYPALSKELGREPLDLMESKRLSKRSLVDYARGEIEQTLRHQKAPMTIRNWDEFVTKYGTDDEKVIEGLATQLGLKLSDAREAKARSQKSYMDFARIEIERTLRGRAAPIKVKDWDDFKKRYEISPIASPYMDDSYLAYCVRGFYDNGGSRCYIVRVAHPEVPGDKKNDPPKRIGDLSVYKVKSLPAYASAESSGYTFKSIGEGDAGEKIKVDIEPVGDEASKGFTVTITQEGSTPETFGKPTPLTPETFVDALTKGKNKSSYVEVSVATDVKDRPAKASFNLNLDAAGSTALAKTSKSNLGSHVETVKDKEFVGDERRRAGIKGLSEIDDINMICAPDLMAGAYTRVSNFDGVADEMCFWTDDAKRDILKLQSQMISYCETKGDRQVILDSLPDMTPQQIRDEVLSAPFSSDRGQAAYYYPWIKVMDQTAKEPGRQLTKLIPPCGHVAGVWARVVTERGVHKAPANESVRGAVELEYNVSHADQSILNDNGINAIRSFPGTGIRIWGARTLATRGNPSWKYVNVRRLFNYLEKSIDKNLQWTVFEPNDQDLWGRVRRNISAFLFTEWKEGKLFGAVPEEAYYVKCDKELNTQEMIDLGRMYVEVGINPVKPAEFVIIRMGQWSGGSETSEN